MAHDHSSAGPRGHFSIRSLTIMGPYGYLLAFLLAHIATSSAHPQLPRFNLQQTESATLDHATLKTCDRMRALEKLTNTAETEKFNFDVMVAEDNMSQEEINFIVSDSGPLASELRKLKANTTLTAQCAVLGAHQDAVAQCTSLGKLEKLAELASNKTAYNEHLAGEILNSKQVDQLQKNMEQAELKLQKLRTNSTLIILCNTEPGLRPTNHGDAGMAQQQGSAETIANGEYVLLLLEAALLTHN
jgi:hypothetical protein